MDRRSIGRLVSQNGQSQRPTKRILCFVEANTPAVCLPLSHDLVAWWLVCRVRTYVHIALHFRYVAMVTPLQVAYEVPKGTGWEVFDALVDLMYVVSHSVTTTACASRALAAADYLLTLSRTWSRTHTRVTSNVLFCT